MTWVGYFLKNGTVVNLLVKLEKGFIQIFVKENPKEGYIMGLPFLKNGKWVNIGI